MARLSPSTVAINSIAHSLANALDASVELDVSISEDIRALLRIAAAEIDRVRKANRKAQAAAKRADKQPGKKHKSKRAPAEATEAQPKLAKPKGRVRKAEAANGVAAH